MRDKLAERSGQRHLYIARLKVYGVRHRKGEQRKRRGTALMKPVYNGDMGAEGHFLAPHLWVSQAEPFVLAGVERGQWVRFSAVAVSYAKGYEIEFHEMDYTLTDAEDIQILEQDYYGERPDAV